MGNCLDIVWLEKALSHLSVTGSKGADTVCKDAWVFAAGVVRL